jgi:hypothetical protein
MMNGDDRRGVVAARLAIFLAAVLAAAGFWYFAGASRNTTIAPARIPNSDSVEKAVASRDEHGGKKFEKASFELLFPDWPETPKPELVIALTGEMNGYLRPCGCSEGQSGGLARRAGLLSFLRDMLKFNVLAVDLGDVVGGKPKLEEMRFDAARKGLARLGYKVVALGRQDLTIPLLTLAQKLANETDGLKTVLGNIKAADKDMQDILAGTSKPIEIIEIGGNKVAVGSLMDPEFVKGDNSEIKLDPVDAASTAMLKAASDAKAEVKVLLAYMTKEKAIDFAKKNQGWDVMLTRSNGDDAHAQLDQHREGETLIVQAGRKGKWTGIVGYWPEAKFKYRYAVVEANPSFDEDKSVEEIYNGFVKQIADSDVLTTWSKLPHSNGDQYVGAETCGKCHTKAYKKWREEVDSTHGKGHGHSFAFESLKKDKAKYQTSNPECLECHTTGFNFRTGFVSETKSPTLLGNQCENCHGPGKRHSENKDDLALRKQMKQSQLEIENKTCRGCHDLDNSPNFKFEKYWPKVAHPWRD